MARILVLGSAALSPGERFASIADAAVIVDNGRIEAVGPAAELSVRGTFDERIGGDGVVILPGMVNAHFHAGNLFRLGMTDEPLETWLIGVHAACSGLPEDVLHDATLFHACEQLKNGITSCVDNMPIIPELPCFGVEAVARAYGAAGMRASIAPIFRDQNTLVYGDTQAVLTQMTPAAAQSIEASMDELGAGTMSVDAYLATIRILMDRVHDSCEGRVRMLLSPYSPQWTSDEALTSIRQAASEWGVGLQLHLMETQYQWEYAQRQYGCSAVKHLQRLGVLGPDVSLAHGIWLSTEDLDILAEQGATIVHNPASNLRLGSGKARIHHMLKAGVRVAVGTDGLSFNGGNDLLSDLRLADFVQREPGINGARISASQWLQIATANGAQVFGQAGRWGELNAGQQADLILVRRERIETPFISGQVPPEQALLQFAEGRDVDTVLVDGRVVVRSGRVVGVDEEALLARLRANFPGGQHAIAARSANVNALKPEVKRFYQTWKSDQKSS